MSALDLYALRARLGGIVSSAGTRWLGPGPGHSTWDRSLSVRIADNGRVLVYSFAGDDLRACRDHLTLSPGAEISARPTYRTVRATDHKPDREATATWEASRRNGDIVRAYLVRRAITLPVPPTLRQGTALVLGRTTVPAMIAAVQGPDRRVFAIQTTLLTWSAKKAPVTIPKLGKGPIGGNTVRLAAATDVLGLAEGIETALSAQQLTSVPCWATLGDWNLPKAKIPASVRELHIFADADPAGQRAADAAAAHHSRRGVKVCIRTPLDGLGDWNDVLRASSGRDTA